MTYDAVSVSSGFDVIYSDDVLSAGLMIHAYEGDNVEVLSMAVTSMGETITGWNTKTDGSGAHVDLGSVYIVSAEDAMDGRIVLYAESLRVGQEITADDLRYRIVSTGPFKASLIGYEGSPSDLVVPSEVELEGNIVQVSEIGSKAFYRCSTLRSADLGAVSKIQASAFAGCQGLESVTFPASLKSVASSSFTGTAFVDSDGSELGATAKALAGSTFSGRHSVLTKDSIPVSSTFSADGIQYGVLGGRAAVVTGAEPGVKDVEVPGTVKNGRTVYSVVAVADWAFEGSDIVSVSVPSGVFVGSGAFYGCESLESADIIQASYIGAKSFFGCTSLREARVSADIGQGAFQGCAGLRVVEIAEGVATIGADGLKGCASILGISFPSTLESIGKDALSGQAFRYGTFTVEATAENLAGRTFSGSGGVLDCAEVAVGATFTDSGLVYSVTSLSPREVSVVGYEGAPKSVAIPADVPFGMDRYRVVSVGASAFYGCRTLSSLDLGSVESVGVKAFANCTGLMSVDLGDSIETLSAYSFCKCSKLKTVDLGLRVSTLSTIGSYSFYKCSALEDIVVPSTVKTIGASAFSAVFLDGGAEIPAGSLPGYAYIGGERVQGAEVGRAFESGGLLYEVTSSVPARATLTGSASPLVSLSVPETVVLDGYTLYVTAVASQAFYKATSLARIDLGSVETVGTKAFAYCTRVTSLDLGDSARTLGAYSFFRCSALGSVDIPSTVSTVGSYAFAKCSALKEVHMDEGVKKVSKCAFKLSPVESVSFPTTLASLSETAFSSTFLDAGGAEIERTAAGLAGRSFAGVGDVLVETPRS